MNTLARLLALADLVDDEPTAAVPTPSGFPFAGPVAIRAVTHYYVGNVIDVRDGFVILDGAAWIADTGRWSTFLEKGEANEVEPFPGEVAVSLGAIVDAAPWGHALLRTVK